MSRGILNSPENRDCFRRVGDLNTDIKSSDLFTIHELIEAKLSGVNLSKDAEESKVILTTLNELHCKSSNIA